MRKFITLFFVIIAVIGALVIGCSSTTDDNTTEHLRKIIGPEFTTANDPNPVKVPENAVEVISKRGRHAKIYDNLDGSFTAVINAKAVHYKDANDQWQEIESFDCLAKMAIEEDTKESLDWANPQWVYDPPPPQEDPYYGDVCPECKLGDEEGATGAISRLLPEFDLSTPDNVGIVTAASIYYTVRDTTSSVTARLTTYIGINYRPTLLRDQDENETNYANCANGTITLPLLSEDPQSFGLGGYERGKIEDRCNGDEDDEWYAVGYKLYDESYFTRFYEDENELYFTFWYN